MATKKELQDALTTAGVTYDDAASKADLEELAAAQGVTVGGDEGTVKMVGPNGGKARTVPKSRVEHFEALGHKRA